MSMFPVPGECIFCINVYLEFYGFYWKLIYNEIEIYMQICKWMINTFTCGIVDWEVRNPIAWSRGISGSSVGVIDRDRYICTSPMAVNQTTHLDTGLQIKQITQINTSNLLSKWFTIHDSCVEIYHQNDPVDKYTNYRHYHVVWSSVYLVDRRTFLGGEYVFLFLSVMFCLKAINNPWHYALCFLLMYIHIRSQDVVSLILVMRLVMALEQLGHKNYNTLFKIQPSVFTIDYYLL